MAERVSGRFCDFNEVGIGMELRIRLECVLGLIGEDAVIGLVVLVCTRS